MTDEFWSATDELKLIYQWARARYAAPWAVFGAVVLRVTASTGPHVQLPGVIGGRASLNLGAMFVAPSGGGKGVSDKVARLAWPATIIERPVGSGEGISALFTPPKKDGVEPITRAILSVPEVDTLTGLASRQGNILLAQLKGALMGELIGQSNASEATTRVVQPHTYRCCLSIGAQPGHAQVIFNDATGGSPQRFLWFPTTDPDMPATAIDDPEPLNTRLPTWALMSDDVVEIQYGTDEIRATIIDAHIARQRGEGEALDGHALLTRCKIAAGLAVLHHRMVVSELDWQLSGIVMAVSDQTRNWMIEHAKRAARAKVRDRALARAEGDRVYDNRLLDGVKNSILRALERDGEQAGNVLRSRMGKRDRRDMFDQAIALLEHEGLVVSIAVERGSRYRLTGVQGEPPVQGVCTQVNQGEPKVQGEPEATVTALDNRRSYTKSNGKPACREWLNEHIDQQLANGVQHLDSFAVYAAGADASDYSKASVANAVHLLKAAGRIRTAGKTGRTERWCIDPALPVTYTPVREVVDNYLDLLGPDATMIDQTHFYAAMDAANVDRGSARKVLVRDSVRVDSQPAHGESKSERVWVIIRADGKSA